MRARYGVRCGGCSGDIYGTTFFRNRDGGNYPCESGDCGAFPDVYSGHCAPHFRGPLPEYILRNQGHQLRDQGLQRVIKGLKRIEERSSDDTSRMCCVRSDI